jgi:hypothetical protein
VRAAAAHTATFAFLLVCVKTAHSDELRDAQQQHHHSIMAHKIPSMAAGGD